MTKVPKRNILKQFGMSKAVFDIFSVDFIAKNIVEWKQEIFELWTLGMSDSTFLQKLVASMPRRLAEVIEKYAWTISYMMNKLLVFKEFYCSEVSVFMLPFVNEKQGTG